jgi:multiple RNA-binding domain-containing protein 1
MMHSLQPLFTKMGDVSPDETATSTRVFVSGLPPKFTSDDLRKHFSHKSDATDAHVFPDRRIGFVGFRDHETATDAVRYFNKSFIRMSKIAVSLARPVEVRRDANGQGAPVSLRRDKAPRHADANVAKKRKRDARDDGETERGTQEAGHPSNPGNVQQTNEIVLPAAEHEEPFEGFASDEDTTEHDDKQTAAATSDMDWIRGKTSRTLDLQEPASEPVASEVPRDIQPLSPPALDQEDSGADVDSGAPQTNANSTVAVPNGRLFVRNLSFDVSDADLESLFQSHGKVTEVRLLLFFSHHSVMISR